MSFDTSGLTLFSENAAGQLQKSTGSRNPTQCPSVENSNDQFLAKGKDREGHAGITVLNIAVLVP